MAQVNGLQVDLRNMPREVQVIAYEPSAALALKLDCHTDPDGWTLRRTAPETAKAWRHAVRDVLGGLMARGRPVTGFADGCYVVERHSPG